MAVALLAAALAVALPRQDYLKTKDLAEVSIALKAGARRIELPRGEVVVAEPLEIPAGARGLEMRGHPDGTVLTASPQFRGRAVIWAAGAKNLILRDFTIQGSRGSAHQTVYLPPSNVAFADFYTHNGILIERAAGVRIDGVVMREVAGFAILVSASRGVEIRSARVEDSGWLDAKGRNNTSGGILIEEGTASFEVRDSTLRRIRGNAIWTHSNYDSPRNRQGVIAGNLIEQVARDAVQVGHATGVRVSNNTVRRVGYPVAEVDLEGQGIPVGLDTAGNVDRSAFLDNRLEDVNGQCIDLDGFHHGEVLRNRCVNRKPITDYPLAHAAIVFGNSHPDVQPSGVTVADNYIEGAGYGGVFLVGSGNRIVRNRLLNLNRNGCTGEAAPARCAYALDQPGLLRSGVYLAGAAARPSKTAGNVIEGNVITGFGMGRWCIDAAPGVELTANAIGRNDCRETPAAK